MGRGVLEPGFSLRAEKMMSEKEMAILAALSRMVWAAVLRIAIDFRNKFRVVQRECLSEPISIFTKEADTFIVKVTLSYF